METFASLFIKLATKAGLNIEDAEVKALTTNAELLKLQVPDAVSTGIDNNLLSLTQAQDNHPTLKKHYHAQTLAGFDKRLGELMPESGLSAEKLTELAAEKNTYNRFDLFATALKEAAAAASKTKPTAEDKTALQRQVDDLLVQLNTQKTTYEAQIGELTTARQKDKVTAEIRNLVSGAKTIFDTLPPHSKFAALDALINAALVGKEATFFVNDAGVLDMRGKDESAVVSANNTKYTPQTFLDEVFATNKVLSVTDPNSVTTQQQTPATPKVVGLNNGPQGNSQAVAAANRAVRERFEKNVAG
jgi:hypothetical protein